MMAKRRITGKRARALVVAELRSNIQSLDIEAAATPENLRINVQKLVELLRNTREFA